MRKDWSRGEPQGGRGGADKQGSKQEQAPGVVRTNSRCRRRGFAGLLGVPKWAEQPSGRRTIKLEQEKRRPSEIRARKETCPDSIVSQRTRTDSHCAIPSSIFLDIFSLLLPMEERGVTRGFLNDAPSPLVGRSQQGARSGRAASTPSAACRRKRWFNQSKSRDPTFPHLQASSHRAYFPRFCTIRI